MSGFNRYLKEQAMHIIDKGEVILKEINISDKYTNRADGAIPEVNGLYINLSQLNRNFEIARSLINSNTKFMVVLKGNACGHGTVPVAICIYSKLTLLRKRLQILDRQVNKS